MSSRSLYSEIAEIIETRIWNGYYRPNQKLPNNCRLSVELKVPVVVVQSALQQLKESSLVLVVPRVGSYVIAGVGESEKERYLSISFHRRFPNGTNRGRLAEYHNAFYRQLLRNGLLETLIPDADPADVERGRELGRRNKKS